MQRHSKKRKIPYDTTDASKETHTYEMRLTKETYMCEKRLDVHATTQKATQNGERCQGGASGGGGGGKRGEQAPGHTPPQGAARKGGTGV